MRKLDFILQLKTWREVPMLQTLRQSMLLLWCSLHFSILLIAFYFENYKILICSGILIYGWKFFRPATNYGHGLKMMTPWSVLLMESMYRALHSSYIYFTHLPFVSMFQYLSHLFDRWFLLPCGHEIVASEPICLSRDENTPCMVGYVLIFQVYSWWVIFIMWISSLSFWSHLWWNLFKRVMVIAGMYHMKIFLEEL